MKRRIVIGLVVASVVAFVLAAGAWWFIRGPGPRMAREQIERLLTEALGRPVHVEALEIEAAPALVLRGVVVENGGGIVGEPFVAADSVRLEADVQRLLDRELVGKVDAAGWRVRLVREGDHTNLDGLRHEPDPSAEPLDIHLEIDVTDSQVTLEDLDRDERLVFEDVGLQTVLSNRKRHRNAELALRVGEFAIRDVVLSAIELDASASDEQLVLHRVAATVGDRGKLSGSGQARMRGGDDWQFDIEASDVALRGAISELVGGLVPPIAVALRSPDGLAVEGRAGAEFELSGHGMTWARVRDSLVGSGEVRIGALSVPADALMLQLAAMAGREPTPLTVDRATVRFGVNEGWVNLRSIDLEGAEVEVPVTGQVSVRGELKLKADLMPLVERFGGSVHTKVARYATSLPVRIEGTVEQPKIRPPETDDVVRSLLGGLTRRLINGSEPQRAETQTSSPEQNH